MICRWGQSVSTPTAQWHPHYLKILGNRVASGTYTGPRRAKRIAILIVELGGIMPGHSVR